MMMMMVLMTRRLEKIQGKTLLGKGGIPPVRARGHPLIRARI